MRVKSNECVYGGGKRVLLSNIAERQADTSKASIQHGVANQILRLDLGPPCFETRLTLPLVIFLPP